MNVWQRIKAYFASGTANPNQWLVDWVRPTPNESGVDLGTRTPLTYAPIWNAVNRIAGTVGQLPLILYRSEGRGREKATEHPAYRLAKRQPNQDIGAFQFKRTLTAHALLYGNGRAIIRRNARGAPRELIPLDPSRVKLEVVGGRKWHLYTPLASADEIPIPDSDMLHIAGLGYDGLEGYSLLTVAANSWGLGLAAERASARHFKNNAVPSLVIEAPRGSFRDETKAKEFLSRWQEFIGTGKTVGLLRDGMKANTLSLSAKDSAWLEQRLFQRQEAALWFLLESILGDDSSVSYNSLEAKNQAFLQYSLVPWLQTWEEEVNRKLLTEQQQRLDTHIFKFKTAALLRGTTKDRFEVYSLGLQNEILSPNEVREMEDMNPYPGGDERRNPAINPQQASEPPPPDDDDQADPATAAALDYLLKAEQAAILRAIGRGGDSFNCISWLETFYVNQVDPVAAALVSAGGTREQAQQWCQEGFGELLELCGQARPAQLAAAVAGHDFQARGRRWLAILQKDMAA